MACIYMSFERCFVEGAASMNFLVMFVSKGLADVCDATQTIQNYEACFFFFKHFFVKGVHFFFWGGSQNFWAHKSVVCSLPFQILTSKLSPNWAKG